MRACPGPKWRNTAVVGAFLWAALTSAPAAYAQAYFDGGAYAFPVTNMVGPIIVGQSMNSYTRRGKTSNSRPSTHTRTTHTARDNPSRDDSPHAAALRIGHDAAISKEVRQGFRNQLLQNNPGAQSASAIDRALAMDWLAAYRREIAHPNGLDADNLADAVTAFYISSWALVNRVDTISPRSIASVRDAIRADIGDQPKLAALGAAERQKLGEALIYQTVLAMANREHLHRTGDRALAARMSDNTWRHFRQDMGVDLKSLRLTDSGFVTR